MSENTKGLKESRCSQIHGALRNVENAINTLDDFIALVKGEKPKDEGPLVAGPGPSLCGILTDAPGRLLVCQERLLKGLAELQSLLY